MKRHLNLKNLVKSKSCFLFGSRGVGKSYLIRHFYSDAFFQINLLKSQEFLRLKAHPEYLETTILESGKDTIVIDEIQRLPILTYEVQRLIEEQGFKFLLTGSSARKLKKENANMTDKSLQKVDMNRQPPVLGTLTFPVIIHGWFKGILQFPRLAFWTRVTRFKVRVIHRSLFGSRVIVPAIASSAA